MSNTLAFRSFAVTLAALGAPSLVGCASSSPAHEGAVEAKEVPAAAEPAAHVEAAEATPATEAAPADTAAPATDAAAPAAPAAEAPKEEPAPAAAPAPAPKPAAKKKVAAAATKPTPMSSPFTRCRGGLMIGASAVAMSTSRY